jgi:hypothetical protein
MSIDTTVDTRDEVIPLGSNERCKHELIRQQCGYCRVPPPPAFVEAMFDTPSNGEDCDEYEVVSPLSAPRNGYCAKCDRRYGQGERIFATVAAGDYLCTDCVP